MIALKDNLPVIQLASGQAVAFERDWLVRSLARAAQRAGYGKWWLAEHVAESVTSYLRDQRELTVLPVEQLTKAVQSVLQVIGYAEVGRHFVPAPHKVQISLVDLAREAGTGYELAFFEKLARCIQALLREKNAHFELLGLEPCVKLLRARKVWSRDCDALRAEIVSFAREQTGTAAAQHDVTFSLQ
ncbi:MAG TPA: hypothetical protein VEO95_04020 [Chthoniobacteraceae bacterium]|nr:hypothetical protein [Chthoniobacteraceae bacterium]